VEDIFGGNFWNGKWVIRKFHHRRNRFRREDHGGLKMKKSKLFLGDFKNPDSPISVILKNDFSRSVKILTERAKREYKI